MGREDNKGPVDNQGLADRIHYLANKRNKLTCLGCSLMVILAACLYSYSLFSLNSASGTFKIETTQSDKKIRSVPMFDTDHYFDDRVALVQSNSALNLTRLFTHTTTSFSRRSDIWNELTSDSGLADIQANFDMLNLTNVLSDPSKAVAVNFKFTKGVPLVIEPHFPEGTLESDILDTKKRNSLDVIKWTLETEAQFEIKGYRRPQTVKVKFNFDIQPTHQSYIKTHLKLTRMSPWEVLK